MSQSSATKVPKWVFWLVPIVLVTVVMLAFALSPADLGNYRVGDIFRTATPVQVVTFKGATYLHYAVGKVGAFAPAGYEQLEYTLSPGTQIRIKILRRTSNPLRDGGMTPPEVKGEILNGPHVGARLDLGGISVVRNAGSYFAKSDPSPTYLTLITRGSGQ